jgi:PQQ-dependent dehydrogenase (s-GDH family)
MVEGLLQGEYEEMKRKRVALIAVSVVAFATMAAAAPAGAATGKDRTPEFTQRVVATGLGDPYEIAWGPDGFLWATEKSGKKVTRIDPQTGATSTALDLPQAVHTEGGQDGVLGLAFHPELLKHTGQDYVYISYTYDADPADDVLERRTKIARYTYDAGNQLLHSPQDIIAGLPASTDHQSARLRFGPDGKLYYTIGDQGANQLAFFCVPNEAQRLPTADEVGAQDWTAYRGKTLRLNLDGSIPADNPVLDGVRSHVYTYGHRNAQGLDFAPNGRLYQNEQGPKTDDEINILQKGGNYGWPYVVGYRDDKAYVYANWSASSPTPCAELTYSDLEIPPSVPQQKETDWNGTMISPIHTFGTVESGFNFTDPKCAEGGLYFICWPTIAPSSLAYYPAKRGGIPGWGNSLVMTNLKDGTVYQIRLTNNGTRIGEITTLWKAQNRYRDTAFSPDGKSIFVATDSAGLVRDANGAPTSELANPGSIIEFRWQR